MAKLMGEAPAKAIRGGLLVEQKQRRLLGGPLARRVQLPGSKITDEDKASGFLDHLHQAGDGSSRQLPFLAQGACSIGWCVQVIDRDVVEPMALLAGDSCDEGTHVETGQSELGVDAS